MPQPPRITSLPFAQAVGEADARLPVVGVVLRILAEVLEALDAGQQAGLAGGLHDHEVGVLRLVELIALDEVVAQAEVERQLVGDRPVVLDVAGVLLQRDVGRGVAVVQRDDRDRPVHVVGEVRVLHDALARVEGDEQARLVDEVDAGLEVVADAAQPADVPREVVAELPLLLLGASAACWGSGRWPRRSGSSRRDPGCWP